MGKKEYQPKKKRFALEVELYNDVTVPAVMGELDIAVKNFKELLTNTKSTDEKLRLLDTNNKFINKCVEKRYEGYYYNDKEEEKGKEINRVAEIFYKLDICPKNEFK